MTRLGYNPEHATFYDFRKNETPAQREAKIQADLLTRPTRLGGTDLTPTTDHLKPVNKQKRSGGHNHHSHPPQKP